MPLIFPSNTLSEDAGVANSCRFDDGSSSALTRTTETPTNPDIYTFSVWVKRGNIGLANSKIFSIKTGTYGEEKLELKEASVSDVLLWRKTDAGAGDTDYERQTDSQFRDPGAWYHILIAYDSSDGTAGDRMKMYVNGVQETSFSGSVNPDSSETSWLNTASLTLYIGAAASVTQYFDGYMAELAFVDGVAHAVTDFGEFDSDSPTIWKPKDISSGITWGDNGFYLDFEDSSALGNDVSGNNNDFSVSNLDATDQATDTPTNSFCTLNTLVPTTNYTFSEGNCKLVTGGSSGQGGGIGTFGVGAGKWFWEIKLASLLGNHTHGVISELTTELYTNVTALQNDTGVTQFRNDDGGEMVTDGTETTADYGTLDDGDILGVALNADDNQISIYDNGSIIVTNFALSSTRGDFLFPFLGLGINTTAEANFGGCAAFTVSSANQDANGYGNFEYAVPSGYLALCTKNLGSDGG